MKIFISSILLMAGLLSMACGGVIEKSAAANMDTLRVVGVDARTNNRDEARGMGKIPALWLRFQTEKVVTRVPHQIKPKDIIIVRTDFESDETGSYRIIIGVPVKKLDRIPSGLVAHTIPAAKYMKYTTAPGNLQFLSARAWRAIRKDETLRKRRAFKNDFEIMDERTRINPAQARIDVFIGVK